MTGGGRKLVFWSTIGDAYRRAFDLAVLWRLAGPWIIAGAVLLVLAFVVAKSVPTRATMMVVAVAASLLVIASFVSFSVAWHRLVLLDERIAFGDSFRFGRREWRFLLYFVLCALGGFAIAFSIVLGSKLVAAAAGWTVEPSIVPVIAASFATYLWMARVTLALPAIAIDEDGPYFSRAWYRSQGNSFRLLLGSLLCALPPALLGLPFALLGPTHPVLDVAIQTVLFAVNYLVTATYIGFLSLAYRQLRAYQPQA